MYIVINDNGLFDSAERAALETESIHTYYIQSMRKYIEYCGYTNKTGSHCLKMVKRVASYIVFTRHARNIRHRFTWRIKGVRDKDYLDRLNELNLCTLEERRNSANLIELFKIYKGFTTVPFESLFTLDCNKKGTRGNLAKLSKPGCQKDVRKYFFHIV